MVQTDEPVRRVRTQLEAALTDLLGLVSRLSQTQMDWRPADGRSWSVGEVVDHVRRLYLITAGQCERMLDSAVLRGRRRQRGSPIRFTWLERYMLFVDQRNRRLGWMLAPKDLEPEHGRPVPILIADVRARHQVLLDLLDKLSEWDTSGLQSTTGHRVKVWGVIPARMPQMGAWSWLLGSAGHTRRHLAQIHELLGTAGFPTQ